LAGDFTGFTGDLTIDFFGCCLVGLFLSFTMALVLVEGAAPGLATLFLTAFFTSIFSSSSEKSLSSSSSSSSDEDSCFFLFPFLAGCFFSFLADSFSLVG